MPEIQWTNPSVKHLAGTKDPISIIVSKTRGLVLDAMDNGWQGPPFDPIHLAQQLSLAIVPRDDIVDARLVPNANKACIEYNPNRSRSRIRFSIAHEIAHTLFPDYLDSTHNRSGVPQRPDEWQLELLCNISAAEILMPAGPSLLEELATLTIDKILEIRRIYDVSIEAVLLRIVKLTPQPITIFSAAKEKDSKDAPYRIDYIVNSSNASLDITPGTMISPQSVLSECTAVGYTAKKREKWLTDSIEFDIECVGVAPYSNSIYPRVMGIIRTKSKPVAEPSAIRYLIGDATEPRGSDTKIVAQIVNDESKKWGKGFGLFVSKKWPAVRTDFVKWAKGKNNLKLGNCHSCQVADDIVVFSMIAQEGFGASPKPRIRYRALAKCLESLLFEAQKHTATIHIPRIGTGYAGGNWMIISEMINEILVKEGVRVTVYDPPGQESRKVGPNILDFFMEDEKVT